MNDETLERLRARRNNARRYRRLLATRLTDLERAYIERRLREEQASVDALLREAFPDRASFRFAATGAQQQPTKRDLNDLLHPADAFSHPMDVVEDCDLTSYEKRAILSSWAAEACAVQDGAELSRSCRGAGASFDDILDALRVLESRPHTQADPGHGSGRHTGTQDFGDAPSL